MYMSVYLFCLFSRHTCPPLDYRFFRSDKITILATSGRHPRLPETTEIYRNVHIARVTPKSSDRQFNLGPIFLRLQYRNYYL